MSDQNIKVGVIDMTPSWQGLLRDLLLLYAAGDMVARDNACKELEKMAKAADAFVELQKNPPDIPEVKMVIVQEDDGIQVVYANVPALKFVILDSSVDLLGQEHISVSEVFESDGVPTETLHEMWTPENWAEAKGKKRATYYRQELIARGF